MAPGGARTRCCLLVGCLRRVDLRGRAQERVSCLGRHGNRPQLLVRARSNSLLGALSLSRARSLFALSPIRLWERRVPCADSVW